MAASGTRSAVVGPRPGGTLLWAPLLAIGAAAFAAEIPFFFFGTPSGHDMEFHLYSWLEVLAQWKRGIVYPRWAALAHFGYGEPRFVFYPPASWTLGAALSAIFQWQVVSEIYIWIALVAAGAAMFMLARRWLDRREAVFAAAFYAVNPYHLVIVYWRSAFAELLASCLVPLLLLCVFSGAESTKEHWRAVVPLTLVLAAAWLTNAPAAVMIHYALVLLVVYFAWRQRSPRIVLISTAAVVLGACLAAFYLLPAIYEQKWVNIAEAVSQGSRPIDNFIFMHTTDVDHDHFNRIVSWVAVLEMVTVAAAAWAAGSWRKTKRDLWSVLVLWAAACSVLMMPVSSTLWTVLPKLEFMQFPWRWLLCLSMIFCFFVTVGSLRWQRRAAVCAIALILIAVAWRNIQAPWWDNGGDLREMQDNMATGAGYEGTDEYTRAGADPAAVAGIDQTARNVTVSGPAHAAIRVRQWDAEHRVFTAEMSARDELVVRLFSYPAWRVEVNGSAVQTEARPKTGQMLVPVEAGLNRVDIVFVRTWDRTVGGWISILSALSLGAWLVGRRKMGMSRLQN